MLFQKKKRKKLNKPKESLEIFLKYLLLNLWGFPHSSVGKESPCNAGDSGLIPGSGRSAGEGIGYPLQYSGLENSINYIVHGVTKSQSELSDLHFHFLSFIEFVESVS